MPSNMWQEMAQPWCATSGIQGKRLLHPEAWQQAILDHQEFMGEELGRKWVLQALPRAWNVWNEHNGFCCHGGSNAYKQIACFLLASSALGNRESVES